MDVLEPKFMNIKVVDGCKASQIKLVGSCEYNWKNLFASVDKWNDFHIPIAKHHWKWNPPRNLKESGKLAKIGKD